MNFDDAARQAFVRECGSAVTFHRFAETTRGTEFFFTLPTGTAHSIATSPASPTLDDITGAASRAGRWAKVMADAAVSAGI